MMNKDLAIRQATSPFDSIRRPSNTHFTLHRIIVSPLLYSMAESRREWARQG